jgi:dsDNA-specific endonuclease/ATPase MutS2
MDYRIIAADGAPPGGSDALALAGLLGLDAAIIERAEELYADVAAGPLGTITE